MSVHPNVWKRLKLNINLMSTAGFVCLLCNLAAFSNEPAFLSLSISSSQSSRAELAVRSSSSTLHRSTAQLKTKIKKKKNQQKRIILQPVLVSNCSYPVPVSTGSCNVFFLQATERRSQMSSKLKVLRGKWKKLDVVLRNWHSLHSPSASGSIWRSAAELLWNLFNS